jgi:RNA polymerase sigma-70 factor (sigma-E family)
VRQGAEADFRGWVSSSRGRLRRTAFLLCGDWFLADDLVQDALTRMFSGWERVRAGGDPDAYARKVLLNLYLNSRQRPWRREESRSELPDAAAPAAASGVDGDRDQLIAALREVPARQRAVLVLRYWEDLSVEQTAAVLGTAPGTIKSQASRGLDALRHALAARGMSELLEVKEPS